MSELPDWQPLNGVAPAISDIGGPGRIVVLVASERASSGGWAATAALELARSWSREGRRVILVDGALQHPTLHTAAGVANREGLSDATLHGASVGRVSVPVDGGAFFLIPAGSVVADAQSVARSDRWHRLSSGMTEAGVLVALFLQDGEEGTPAFLGAASDIVVLAETGEAPPAAVRDLEPLVRAVTGPSPDGSLVPADAGSSFDANEVAGAAALGIAGSFDGDVSASTLDPGASARAGVADILEDPYDEGLPGVEGAPGMDPGSSDPPSDAPAGAASVVQHAGRGGMMTMVLFVVIAVIVAGALGYVLWSGIG